MKGAAALSVYDEKNSILYLIRNNQRPLYIMKNESSNILFWASDYGFISLAARISKIALENKNDTNIYRELKPHHLYSFKITTSGFEQLKTKELKPYTYSYNSNSIMGYNKNWSLNGKSPGVNKKRFNNDKWNHKTGKGNEETKGLKFTLKHYVFNQAEKTRWIVGNIISEGKYKDTPIRIYPINENEWDFLETYIGTAQIFKSRSRARIKDDGSEISHLRLTGTVIRKVGTDETPTVKKQKSNVDTDEETTKKTAEVIDLFPMPDGQLVKKEVWENFMQGLGFSCTTCGNPVDYLEAGDLEWVGNKICACKSCQGRDEIRAYLDGVMQ